MNELFQSETSQIHLIFSKSRQIFEQFAKLLMSEDQYFKINNSDFRFILDSTKWKIYENEIFLTNLRKEVDFEIPKSGFEIDFNVISNECIEFSKKLCVQLLFLIGQYLPINDGAFMAFQLLDPHNRNIQNNKYLFREYLAKKFVKCYEFSDYESLLNQFENFALLDDKNLPLEIENYRTSNSASRHNVEQFWINVFRIVDDKNPFKLLSQFFLQLLTIPHSNSYIEQQFSQVNLIKTEKRNLLDVTTVSSILKVKSYYSEINEEGSHFEPQEKYYYLYNLSINSRIHKYSLLFLTKYC